MKKRKATPPRPSYIARKPAPPPGTPAPLKKAVDRRRELKGGLAGKWTPRFVHL